MDILEHKELIISIALILIGLIIIIWQSVIYSKIQACKNWNDAKGEIISSKVISFSNTGEVDKTYRAEIEYSYTVKGEKFTSKRIHYSDKLQSSIRKKYDNLVAKYPEGKEVTVFYNPRDYKQAIIERGLKKDVVILFIMGILSLSIGISLFLGKIS